MSDRETRGSRGAVLRSDALAAFAVALVLVPQALAYATLAGMPPVYGLYAATLPLLVAALFASSKYLQTGPVAMTSMLTLAAIAPLAAPQSADYVALAAMLAIMVGLVRIVVGALGAGYFAYLLSQPALLGFSSAAAILICASQFPALLGVASPRRDAIPGALWLLSQPDQWSFGAVALGLGTVAIVLGARARHPMLPGVLVAVVAGASLTGLGVDVGPTVGAIGARLPLPQIALSPTAVEQLLIPALVIAFVGFAEPAAIARTFATAERTPWSADKELIAQGAANVAAGALGAFPVGGSFSRTTLARLAGARSRLCGALVGLFVCAVLPFGFALAWLPNAVLAGIVLAAVLPLVRLRALVELYAVSRAQAVVASATFLLTLLLAPRIDLAVLLGVLAGVLVHLWRERRIDVRVVFDADTGELELTPIGVLFFGSAQEVDDALIAALAAHPAARSLHIDLRRVGRIDYTGALALHRVARDAVAGGLAVRIVVGSPPQGPIVLTRVFGADAGWIEAKDDD